MSDATEPRVVVLGLDVGDGALIRAWAESGELPAFAELMARGASGDLGTTAETLHVSAWPSLYTGVGPGEHGVYYTHQPAPGEQGAVRFGADQYGAPPVWQRLTDAGKRCVVLDAPYTHPLATSADGNPAARGQGAGSLRQVFEWGTWAHYREPGATPEGLLGRLGKAVGSYPLRFEANQIGLGALDPAELAPELAEGARAHGRAARWFAGRDDWDLLWVVFSETHPAAHYLWPEGATAAELAQRDPADPSLAGLLTVYRALDEAIARILETLRPEDSIFVVSGDGGGPNHAGWHLLPEVLEALDFLVPPGRGDDAAQGTEAGNGAAADAGAPAKRGLYARLRGLISPEMRQAVSRYLPATLRDALMKRNQAAAVDWSRTRAYALPTDLEGCIRINLRGREPEGIVEPEAYEALREELAGQLEELRHGEDGGAAVRRVVRVDDVHPGARRDHLPDLVVLWDEACGIRRLSSPRIGVVEGESPDARCGTHRPPGFVIARGPGFEAGTALQGGHVFDLAPTLLERLGVSGAEDLEGRAWGSAPR